MFAAAGFGWVTSHIYRKTVATLMDEAGLTARQAADQLGHAKVSMTQDNYFGRKVARTGAAGLLEIFGEDASPTNPGGKPGATKARDRAVRPSELGFCSSDWTRTSNPAINSRMLCQLSYGGPSCAGGDHPLAGRTLAHAPRRPGAPPHPPAP